MDNDFENPDAPTVPAGHSSRNVLLVCWQRRSLVLLGAVVGLILGVLFYAQKHPVYQSGAQILVVKKRSDALPVAGGDPRLSFYEDYVSTHLVLLRSPLIIEKAVKKRDLAALPSFIGHGDPTGLILAGLVANRDVPKDSSAPPNNIINLSYKGGDSADTAAVLNAVIDSYRDFLDEKYRSASDSTLEQINKARDLLKHDVADKEKKYQEFRKKSPLLWTGSDGANLHLNRIKDFQTKQTALLARAADGRERLRAIDKAKKDGSSRAVMLALASRPLDGKSTAVNLQLLLEERLFPLLIREKELLQIYGVDHPDILRVRDQIVMTKELFNRLDAVEKKADEPKKRSGDALDIQVQALQQEVALVETSHAALARLLEEEEKKARSLEAYELQDAAFRSDIKRTTDVLNQTLKRLEEINLVRDFGGYEAAVIAAPGAGYKVSPIAWQIIIGGLMMGLLAGVGLAYLLDVMDKSFRTPEEIRRRLGLPVVGHIPFLPHHPEAVKSAGLDGSPVRIDASLCSHHRPTSIEAESYRSVRTALYFSTQGERHKLILVTSPNMGDGKTTLIANLAVSIAQSGRKVILVDADMRRPRIHRLFGAPAKVGLSSLIGQTAELCDVVQVSDVPGLSILPCGPRPANPSEMLTSPRFEEVLEELRDSYDYVLIDTPPLLAVTDPCIVAPHVDGVLLTLRASKNGRPAAERARDLLGALRIQVFGVVVNGVGKHGAMRGYGYEHYHYGDEYSYEYTNTEVEADHVTPDAAAAETAVAAVNGKAADYPPHRTEPNS